MKKRKGGLTPKQWEEVNWLADHYKIPYTPEQAVEYVKATVYGKGSEVDARGLSSNPLFQAKRRLDINVRYWRYDILDGILDADELRDGSPFLDRVIDGILAGLPGGFGKFPYVYLALKPEVDKAYVEKCEKEYQEALKRLEEAHKNGWVHPSQRKLDA